MSGKPQKVMRSMGSDPHFIHTHETEQVEMVSGVFRRTLGISDRMMVVEIMFTRGARVPEHDHHHDQVGYVVRGQLELTVAGETRTLHPGDSYAVNGGIRHSAYAPQETLLVESFTPVREEFRMPPKA
jgi:quercetin dioxygenase-like cupin family protein